MRDVAGKAYSSAFYVNQRFSIPGLPAPYVFAQVAITEDPRVRLTTNIVGSTPATSMTLELGQQVEVVFEKDEDVCFRCSGRWRPESVRDLPADEIAPQRLRRTCPPAR